MAISRISKLIKRLSLLWLFGHLPWFIKNRLEEKSFDAEQATIVSFIGNFVLIWPALICLKFYISGLSKNPYLYFVIITSAFFWAMSVAMVDFLSRLVVFIGYMIVGETNARPGLAPVELLAGLGYLLHIPFLRKFKEITSMKKRKPRDFGKLGHN